MANLCHKFYSFVCFMICTIILRATSIEGNLDHHAVEFQHHTIVTPKLFRSREKRGVESVQNSNNSGQAYDLTIDFSGNEMHFILDLELDKKSFSDNLTVFYQKNGQEVQEQVVDNDEICHYHGHIRHKQDSWAAVSTCDGIRGVVYNGSELFYLEPTSNKKNFLYKHSDITTEQKCGTSTADQSYHSTGNATTSNMLRHKRSPAVFRGPYNANDKSRYIEVEMVVDQRMYRNFDSSIKKVHQYCKDIMNIIHKIYQPLNVFIVLVNIVVWNENDKIRIADDSGITLPNFSDYRKERLKEGYYSDNGQLLTDVQFIGGVVGKAFKYTICQQDKSSGINVRHSTVTALVAQTIAHELGHNLGMNHDDENCNCKGCLMAPQSSSMVKIEWSSCSRKYLADTFRAGKDFCLMNKPKKILDSPACGNGFVEAGEECDCGLKDICANPCCNATSCKLLPGAACATGECCDLTKCRLKSGGQLCRSAMERECDLPEYCTGTSEYCPDDIFKLDGSQCDNGAGFCYLGNCPSHTAQCQLLWGESSKSSEFCYPHNAEGDTYNNCGYNKKSKTLFKCKKNDVLCGTVHCTHTKNGPLLDTGVYHSRWWTKNGYQNIDCSSLASNPEMGSIDMGLVPNGAKCGDDKMCVNQKCVSVHTVQQNCPNNCSGNGVCNSNGNCHCDVGYSPPFCLHPGPGGSEDSGVVKDLTGLKYYTIALYVLFLGLIPLIIIIIVVVNYKCSKRPVQKKEIPPLSKAPYFDTNPFIGCFGLSHTNVEDKSLNKETRVSDLTYNRPLQATSGRFASGELGQHKASLSNTTEMPKIRNKNVQKQSIGTKPLRLKGGPSNAPRKNVHIDKEWKEENAALVVKKLPILNIENFEAAPRKANMTNAPKLGVNNSSQNVQNNKAFFESLEFKTEVPNTKARGTDRKSKGLQLIIPTTNPSQMRTRLLRTPDSASSSTSDTPPVEKHFRLAGGRPMEGYIQGTSSVTIKQLSTPPPPPPACFKPRV